MDGNAPTTLATDDKWNAFGAGANDTTQIYAPVDPDTMNFVTEITTEMVEVGMINEHASMLLHQTMTDELPGHSSDKVHLHPIVCTEYICAAYAVEQQCTNILAQMGGMDKTTPTSVCSTHHLVSGGCEKQRIVIDAAFKDCAPLYDSNVNNMHVGHSRYKSPRPQSCSDTDCGWNKTHLTVPQYDIDLCREPKDLICSPCNDVVTLDRCSIAECHLIHGSTKHTEATLKSGKQSEWYGTKARM